MGKGLSPLQKTILNIAEIAEAEDDFFTPTMAMESYYGFKTLAVWIQQKRPTRYCAYDEPQGVSYQTVERMVVKWDCGPEKYNKAHIAIFNSIKRLIKRGLIEKVGRWGNQTFYRLNKQQRKTPEQNPTDSDSPRA